MKSKAAFSYRAFCRAALLCLALVSAPALASPERPFSFALLGDMPYSDDEEPLFAEMLQRINREPLEFVVHIGDIKNGYSWCSDELFHGRFELFSQSHHPFIYTPGDNEWTDCQRWTGGGYDPLERLNKLREIFFADEKSIGQRKLALQRQSANPRFTSYRENARWEINGVLFITLNVPGGNNNFGRSAAGDAEYRERSEANRRWMSEAFKRASGGKMLGLAIFFQANPGFERLPPRPKSGYRQLLAELAREAAALKKPVLVGHGDTHRLRVDRPLRDPKSGAQIANLVRVETFGSPLVGWVRVMVDPANPNLFQIQPRR